MMRRELQRTAPDCRSAAAGASTAHIDWLQSGSACGCTSVSVPASYVQPAGHVRSAPGATAEQSGVALVSVAVPVHDGPGHCMPANLPSVYVPVYVLKPHSVMSHCLSRTVSQQAFPSQAPPALLQRAEIE